MNFGFINITINVGSNTNNNVAPPRSSWFMTILNKMGLKNLAIEDSNDLLGQCDLGEKENNDEISL